MIELFLLKEKIKPIFYESDYNQYYEDALFNEKLIDFKPDVIYIHTTIKNIQNFTNFDSSENYYQKLLNLEKSRWEQIWEKLWHNHQCPIIQNNVEFPLHRFMGNGSAYLEGGNILFINQLNNFFSQSARDKPCQDMIAMNFLMGRFVCKNTKSK